MSSITPKRYTCYRAASPLKIDGHLTDGPWKAAPWTDLFVDDVVVPVELNRDTLSTTPVLR